MASRDPLVRAQLDVALLRKSLRDIATMAHTALNNVSTAGRAMLAIEQEAAGSETAYLAREAERKAKDATPLTERELLKQKWGA